MYSLKITMLQLRTSLNLNSINNAGTDQNIRNPKQNIEIQPDFSFKIVVKNSL